MKNVNYVHFDNKMSKKEANNYLRNISNHQYLPFINYEIDKKKWDSNHNKTGETRTISVASVKDNYVYQYFNNIISNKYEKFIESSNINDCVCAYRKGQHKSNVNYSAEVFKFIADSINVIELYPLLKKYSLLKAKFIIKKISLAKKFISKKSN